MATAAARRHNKPEQRRDAQAALRAAQAMRLRTLGLSYREIAAQAGYGSRAAAYHAVQRELARALQEPADDLRRLEHEHLLELRKVYAVKALRGDQHAAEFCLRLADRLARLQGIDLQADASQNPIVPLVREYQPGILAAMQGEVQ